MFARTGVRKNIDREAMAKLVARDWPGNVRELENEVLRLCALSGDTITERLVESPLTDATVLPLDVAVRSLVGKRADEVEAALIRATLEKTKGNKTEAARLLGIPRRTFYARLDELRIDDSKGGSRADAAR
jgi:DNA-binding NtrC family response regulator